MTIAENRRNVTPAYYKERSCRPVRIVLQITLETGVTVYYDDARGCAYGDDGKTYFPVCREDGDDLTTLGWSPEISSEYIV